LDLTYYEAVFSFDKAGAWSIQYTPEAKTPKTILPCLLCLTQTVLASVMLPLLRAGMEFHQTVLEAEQHVAITLQGMRSLYRCDFVIRINDASAMLVWPQRVLGCQASRDSHGSG